MTTRALIGNAADEGQVKKAARREQAQLDRERAILTLQVATPAGRAFVWWVLRTLRYNLSTFSTDPITLAGLAAQHEAALQIAGRVKAVDRRAWKLLLMEVED